MGLLHTFGRLHQSRGLRCVRLSELSATTAGPTSAPTPPARSRSRGEWPISGHSGARPPQHQGTAGQAQIEGRRPIWAVCPHLLWIPMRSARWHSCGARAQDPRSPPTERGPTGITEASGRSGPLGLCPHWSVASAPRAQALSEGEEGPTAAKSVAPPLVLVTCITAVAGARAPSPSHPSHLCSSSTSDRGFGAASGAAAGGHGPSAILVAGPDSSRSDSSLASLRSLAPRNIPGSTGRCFRVEINSASSGG
ncbi:hypothetical protein NDU88_003037 [Pleurodeles waltl]|uniref:Uncharacterized protein n=1 Tax=Pleurodeles waltl TaxID=8319 RepID=A0AAV7UYV0_PLEWA|nr:hypothetical protein NDU88_003037 [Pleurodeles waltl]